jgi:hypothetical protein
MPHPQGDQRQKSQIADPALPERDARQDFFDVLE